jgi:excisionase family DNA binding protein
MNAQDRAESSLLTIPEAAAVYRVHPQTIRMWLRRGAPHVRVGKVVRVDLAELKSWARAVAAASRGEVAP